MTHGMVQDAPIGTNLALYEVLMTLMTGALLESRGALIPALAQAGFDQCDSLQIWQELAHGAWEANALLVELNGQLPLITVALFGSDGSGISTRDIPFALVYDFFILIRQQPVLI